MLFRTKRTCNRNSNVVICLALFFFSAFFVVFCITCYMLHVVMILRTWELAFKKETFFVAGEMQNSSLLQGVLIQLLVSFCSIRCYVDCVEYVLRKDTKMKNNLLIKKRENEQLAHFRFIFTQNTRLFHLPHLIIFFITIILYNINHHYIMLKKEELVALGLPEAAA